MEVEYMRLLSISADHKTIKGEAYGYLTGVMYLAPYTQSGLGNLCPSASKGCAAACLFTAGRGAYLNVQTARLNRTKMFYQERPAFFSLLIKEIGALIRKAEKLGMIPCVRLNGTSDIQWEKLKFEGKTIFEHFPAIQFYDYTKIATRFFSGLVPLNYHLTFSRSESNQANVEKVMAKNPLANIAVVFKRLPKKYLGRKVFAADDTDLRFKDPAGVVCGLTAKGRARRDTSGFVVA
jgi:hypothetical protein